MSLGERLYELRKKKGLSQEQVAEQLNVTRQTVSKWETDDSKPDFDKIVPICNLYEITSEQLLTGNIPEIEEVEKEDVTDIKKKKALFIISGIFCYFLSIIFIIITNTAIELNEGISVGGFLLLCAIGTCLIVYQAITLKLPKKEKTELEKKIDSAGEITSGIFAVIYFIVSFTTMAWHLTWIIWIIYSVVFEIEKTIIRMKENNDE